MDLSSIKFKHFLATTSLVFMAANIAITESASIQKSSYNNHFIKVEDGWTGGKTVNDDYEIKWRYDEQNQEIIFELISYVTGYVAVGITESGSMRDADIFITWVKDGKPYVLDCHGPSGGNGAPIIDENNNLHLIAGEESNGITRVRFKRSLRTCDPNEYHDIDIDSNTARMIYAYSNKEPDNDAIANIPFDLKHETSRRGHFDTYLLSPKPPTPQIEEDAIAIDLQLNNITVPNTDTTYWCDVFMINRTRDLNGQKHHLVMSHVLIGGHKEVNAPYVHHLVLHRCHNFPENWTFSDERENGGLCYDGGSRLAEMCTADEVVAAWAVGGEEFYFPPDVGLPIGEDEIEYYVLDMHYDNPNLEEGIKDNSGMHLLLTPTLRTHDASSVSAGLGVFFHTFIPPGAENFKVEGTCHMNCTQNVLPESGVNIFAGFLHTHLLGRAVTVRHIRDGVELPYILQDMKYDFNFQEIILLDNEVQVLPVDAIKTECIYNSMDRTTVTFGGLKTRDEMCLSFLFYYPKSIMPPCNSFSHNPWEIGPHLGVETFYDNPNYFTGMLNAPQGPIVEVNGVNRTWVDFIKQYEWNEESVRVVEEAGITGTQFYNCLGYFTGEMSGPIEVSSAYIPPTAEPCRYNSAVKTSPNTLVLYLYLLIAAPLATFLH